MNTAKQPVLLIADAGGEIGFGHLMRCRELALQIGQLTGRETIFLVDDSDAVARIQTAGMRTEWGAFDRDARTASDGGQSADVQRLAAGCAYVVLDVFGKRELQSGWRARLERPTVVLDRAVSWAREAELIVIPGVTFPPEWRLPKTLEGSDTPIHGGSEYVILREEIRTTPRKFSGRDIDVLAYLYGESERATLRAFGDQNGLSVHLLEKPADDFPDLLSRSKLFLSGFGITFYEALHLGTRPVAWPLSDQHAADASRFFRALGLESAILSKSTGLDLLLQLLRSDQPLVPTVTDGTPRIVELLERTLV
ncbi:MAG: spore coat polysaccharide biosynthesis predicted glycosyltransferase SpsG [Planctomycetota bacterium]|jgi:spore coat polysaccharide biosynthesis predicted glycosyltransferase SpsG